MGLDSVEILMKVEDTFGIKIPDQEAEQILTVGDFHNSVWRHLSGKHSDKCKSQNLFYKLRESFADTFNVSPQKLKLDTSPEEIFPKTNRRQVYLSFADTTNLKLPDLVLTKPWTTLLTTFGFATIIGGLATSLIFINIFDMTKWTLLIPVAGIVLTFLLSDLLNPKRTAIKEITIREFTQHTLALNYSTLVANEGTNRQEMESVINHIIADMAGLDLEEVTPEKKIADDLGID
jgi:acyl carrier protein